METLLGFMKNKFIILFCLIFILSLFLINKNAFADLTTDSNEVITRVGNPAIPNSKSNIVYYCQGNSDKDYVDRDLGHSGCGVTASAIVLSSFGLTNYDPPTLDDVFRQKGWRPTITSYSQIDNGFLQSPWLHDLGFDLGNTLVTSGSDSNGIFNAQKAKEYIDLGYLIIGSSQRYPCANCRTPGATANHVFVIDDVDLSSNPPTIEVRDPNNCDYGDGNVERASNRIKKITEIPWFYAYPIKKTR